MLRWLVVIGCLLGAPGASVAATAVDPTARDVLNTWESDSEAGSFVKHLAAAFPEDTLAAAGSVAAEARKGVSGDALTRFGTQVLLRLVSAEFRFLRVAPDERLIAVARAYGDAMAGLKTRNLALCASMAGALNPDFSVGAAASTADAMIDAMKAGRDSPVRRAPPTPADMRLLSTTTAHMNLSPATIDSIVHPTGAPRSDEAQCELGIAAMHAFLVVPPDVAGRVLAATLSPSADGSAPQP